MAKKKRGNHSKRGRRNKNIVKSQKPVQNTLPLRPPQVNGELEVYVNNKIRYNLDLFECAVERYSLTKGDEAVYRASFFMARAGSLIADLENDYPKEAFDFRYYEIRKRFEEAIGKMFEEIKNLK